jgi:hypothetical protein
MNLYEVSFLLGFEVTTLGNRFPTFRENLMVSSLGMEMPNAAILDISTPEDEQLHCLKKPETDYPVM